MVLQWYQNIYLQKPITQLEIFSRLFAVDNLVKLEEEFEEPKSNRLVSILLWVLLGVLLPAVISSFTYWFWDQIKECFFEFLFKYILR
jgi:hypothetical protein